MTADDVRGEDYEAARPTPARSGVTGDPWHRHHDLCPVHQAPDRAAWCCCIALETAEQDALDRARAAVADVRTWPTPLPHPAPSGFHAVVIKDDAFAAINALRADHA